MSASQPEPSRRRGSLSAEEILDAAARAFARDGFHRTTMKEIAAELGVTAGALYGHFAGKDEIFAAAHERLRQQLVRAIDAPMPGGLSLAQEVELLLLRVFELTEHSRAELAMCLDARVADEVEGPDRPRGFALMRAELSTWFRGRQGQLACDAELAATAFAGIISGLIRARVTDARTEPLVPQAAAVTRLLLGGVAPEGIA